MTDRAWEIQEAFASAIHHAPDDTETSDNRLKVPTLGINSDVDDLAPVSDFRLLADSGQETDLWIMGGDQHCFGRYRSIVLPKMANWLAQKLAEKKMTIGKTSYGSPNTVSSLLASYANVESLD